MIQHIKMGLERDIEILRSAEEDEVLSEENKVSRKGELMRQAIGTITGGNLIGQKFKNGEIRKRTFEPFENWRCPEEFTNTKIYLSQCEAELLTSNAKYNNKKVILQLHGGGYIGAMKNAYRNFASLYCVVGKGISVFTPDYRVAPENPYPAALCDAVESFDWLIKKGYKEENIILAGDSAGGGLALCLCHLLKANGRKLPSAIIAMSPWTDMTASGDSYETNFENDPLFGNTEDSMIYNRDYAGEEDETNPYLSPLFGDFSGFPPILLQVGSMEMLLSDTTRVAAKMSEAKVDVTMTVYDGMFHVFQMAPLTLPESKRAWVEIEKFLERYL